MFVEELEIIITTNIQKAMPNIRKVVKEVKKAVDETKGLSSDMFKNVDMKKVAGDVSKVKKQLGKELGLDINTDKAKLNIQGLKREITGISDKFNQLKGQRGVLGDAFDAQRFKQQAEEIKRATDSIRSSSGYKKYDTQSIQNYIDNFKGADIKKVKVQADTSKADADVSKLNSKLNSINGKKVKANVKTNASTELNKSNSFANRLKNAMQQVKKQMDSSGASSKKISSGLSSAMGSVSKITGSLKVGLGQILKIAGALFSLRSIYSVLSSSANSWLSSQNAQAKQLSANIDYMKYALGSALAPVIQWIVNLIYQALKGVQSLIYALTGVNIFANASAKAYASMAKSADSASKATKAMSPGDIDEVHNIQEEANNGTGNSGTGDVMPNFDLSNVENKLNSLFQKLKEGKWFEAGVEIGNKINESLDKIPWESIKKKASDIGKGIAEFLNGGIAATDWDLVGKTLAEGINTVIEFAYSFVTTFDFKKFGQAIGNTVNGFFKNLDWKKAGETIGKGISGVISTISEFIKTVDWSNVAESIFDFLIEAISNIDWSDIISTIFYLLGVSMGWQIKVAELAGKLAEELGKQVGTYFSEKIEEAGGNVAEGLWNGIIEGLGDIAQWILDNVVTPIIDGFKDALGIHSPSTVMAEIGENIIEGLKKGITEKTTKIGTKISETCTKIKNWFTTGLGKSKFVEKGKDVIEGIKDGILGDENIIADAWAKVETWFTDIVREAKIKISQKWSDIKNAWENITGNIKDKVATMKAKVGTTWSNIRTAWESLVGNIKDKTATMKAKVGTVWNNLKKAWENITGNIKDKTATMKAKIGTTWGNLKNTWNSLMGNFKDKVVNIKTKISPTVENIKGWLNTNFVDKVNSKLPSWMFKIPRLAKGGVLYDETMFVGGEYSGAKSNPEIVTPQKLMYETMLKAINNSNSNSGGTINFENTIKLNGKTLARELIDDLDNEAKRRGYKPLLQH